MKLYLNGDLIITQGTNLLDLLQERKIDVTCVASAINGDFVPRTHYKDTMLEENMKIEIVSPMQGG